MSHDTRKWYSGHECHFCPECHFGVIALRAGRLDEAVDLLRRAIPSRPAFPDAFSNLAVAPEARGQLVKAKNACRAAIRVKPDDPVAHTGLAAALLDLCRADEAIPCFHRAIALQPASPEAKGNLLYNLHYHDGYDAAALWREARD
jgi:Flp pilus assembly protein TadD